MNHLVLITLCMQVVKPLLQERTKLKVRVLQGCGREELLKVIIIYHSSDCKSVVSKVVTANICLVV